MFDGNGRQGIDLARETEARNNLWYVDVRQRGDVAEVHVLPASQREAHVLSGTCPCGPLWGPYTPNDAIPGELYDAWHHWVI